jgi:GT2 family glycosyltransferase
MDLSIIIVHYKTPHLLDNCIASVLLSETNFQYEIIVVDNYSEDNSEDTICSKYPLIKWINMEYNSGFARANNCGIKSAKGEYVLFLNSDTILKKETLSICLSKIKENHQTGLLSCKLLNADESLQISSQYKLPGIWKVSKANPLYIFFTRKKNNKERQLNYHLQLHNNFHEPKWVCGAFMLIPAKILNEKKLFFDESFFMYSEDVLFCHQIKKEGYNLLYTPDTSVYHLSGASFNDSGTTVKSGQIIISDWLLMVKLYSKFYFICYICFLKFNFFLDSILYFKNVLLKKVRITDTESRSSRRFVSKLIRQYFFVILIRYGKKKRNKSFLKFDGSNENKTY